MCENRENKRFIFLERNGAGKFSHFLLAFRLYILWKQKGTGSAVHGRGTITDMKKLRAFLLNALVLTLTSLLMNSIGVWFSLYISGKIGSQAMGVFQLVMSVYGFGVTLAASGINLAATRLVAEELVRKIPQVRAVMVRCLQYCLCFGLFAAVLLFASAQWVGTVWLANGDTVLPLRFMGITLPFVSMSSALSGYFTAVRRVSKNAVVLVLEQLVKIGFAVGMLTLFPPVGLQDACMILIGAGFFAELFSFTMSFLLYFLDRRRYRFRGRGRQGITKDLCAIALPIAFSAYIRSGLVTLKNLLVPVQLGKYGASNGDALSTFGLLHGVVLPVIFFPASFLSAFANLIVPELAECRALCQDISSNRRVHYLVGRMFQMTLLFSICVAGIFFFFSEEISQAVCKEPLAGEYLRIFAVLIPVMYMDTMVDSMLKGLGEQVSSMRYNIIDAMVCVVLVIVLLPRYGAKGYVMVIVVSELLNFALSAGRLIRVTRFHVNLLQFVIKPVFSIGAAAVLSGLVVEYSSAMGSGIANAVLLICVSLAGYLMFLLLTGSLTREDVQWVCGILKP